MPKFYSIGLYWVGDISGMGLAEPLRNRPPPVRIDSHHKRTFITACELAILAHAMSGATARDSHQGIMTESCHNA
jgi:hypothetical protein